MQPQSSPPLALAVSQITLEVQDQAGQHREAFVHAAPFKHTSIDHFFEDAFADRLLAEFPLFDPNLAPNELGKVGFKAVNTNIREIGSAYKELYEMIGSPAFLGLMSRLTGIPDLMIDPKLHGGGTHDNQHGQDLDIHVDFNYDEAQQLHRRLNIIVYLNKEWKTEWGGAIEVHSNPWDHQNDHVQAFEPLFNRCVIFETNEHSWHGFPKIELPPDKRHLSRKSISIYLYTKTRPPEEITPMHATFYAQRPLPARIREGYTLNAQDIADLQLLIERRDDWLRLYHKMELAKNREIAEKSRAIQNLLNYVRAPFTGYILQGTISGIFADLWATSQAQVQIRPLTAVSGLVLRGWRPDDSPTARMKLTAAGAVIESALGSGSFEIPMKFAQPLREPFTLTIETQTNSRLVDPAVDSRDLAFVWGELRAEHEPPQDDPKMLA